MPILKGAGSNPIAIKRGTTDFMKVYMGTTLRWQKQIATPVNVKYGLIYNWYVVLKGIANTGWHIPNETEVDALLVSLGGIVELGYTQTEEDATCQKLKSTNSDFWNTGGEGNNLTGLNFVGTGDRSYLTGNFQLQGVYSYIVTSTLTLSVYFRAYSIGTTNSISRSNGRKNHGRNLRLIKDSTDLSNGETGTYTGNDGKIYPTICVNGLEWLAVDLAETKYNDGNSIPEITDNTEFIEDIDGCMCAYNNDWTNVFN